MNQNLNFKKPLTNYNIIAICKKLKVPLVGVFMDDELNHKLKDGNYIVNLQSSFESGSHWTCFIQEKGEVFFFDPFGVFPDQILHDNFLRYNMQIIMNDRDLQNIKSILCGYFCIGLFLYMKLNRGTTYQKFERYFKMFNYKNTMLNDKIIKDYINGHMPNV